jgi:hypothetical protein
MSDAYGSVADLREACHDIRQPIAGALALAAAALAEVYPSQDTRSRLEHIIKLAEWQSDVVENCLEVYERSGTLAACHTDVIRVFNEAAGYGLGLSAVARQAARHEGRLKFGRGSLGGGRVSPRLPLAASRMQRRTADAACAV